MKLSQNRTEKRIMPSKITINWLFNDIWCYLFITSFDWKISVFQQTFVRVYFILKYPSGFRESFNTHDYFIKLLEKRNWSLHNAVVFGTLVTDISKVFFYSLRLLRVKLIYSCNLALKTNCRNVIYKTHVNYLKNKNSQ